MEDHVTPNIPGEWWNCCQEVLYDGRVTVYPLSDQCVDKAKVEESEQKATEFSKKVRHYSFGHVPFLLAASIEKSFLVPKAPRQAIDFSCSDQCSAVTRHDPYQRNSNRWLFWCTPACARHRGQSCFMCRQFWCESAFPSECHILTPCKRKSPNKIYFINVVIESKYFVQCDGYCLATWAPAET